MAKKEDTEFTNPFGTKAKKFAARERAVTKTVSDDERAARMYSNTPDHPTGMDRLLDAADRRADAWRQNEQIREQNKLKDIDTLDNWYGSGPNAAGVTDVNQMADHSDASIAASTGRRPPRRKD